MKRPILTLALAAILTTAAQAAYDNPKDMLVEMFRRPYTEWREVLLDSRTLLTADFFQKVEQRIRWAMERKEYDDAARFAMVGDLAADVRSYPGNFRLNLAREFGSQGEVEISRRLAEDILKTTTDAGLAEETQKLLDTLK